jgi:hypothetical protein
MQKHIKLSLHPFSTAIAYVAPLVAIAISATLQQPAVAQYPSTQFQSISTSAQGNFATSSPSLPDPQPNDFQSSHRSMSPDSWGSTAPPVQNNFVPQQSNFATQQNSNTLQGASAQIWESEPIASQPANNAPNPSNAANLKSVYQSNKQNQNSQSGTSNQTEFRSASFQNTRNDLANTSNSIEGKFNNASFRSPAPSNSGPLTRPASQYTQPAIEQSNVQLLNAPNIPQNQTWIPNGPGPVQQLPPSVASHSTNARYPLGAGPTNYQGDTGYVDGGSGWGFPEQSGFQSNPVVEAPYQLPPGEPYTTSAMPAFNPQQIEPNQSPLGQSAVGKRKPWPTQRGSSITDTGEKFDFEEKKKEYPPFSEILATGRYFGSVEFMYLQPFFQGNTAIATEAPGFGESIPFQFDREIQPRFRLGFESKYGPGIELNYMSVNAASEFSEFTSNGAVTGQTSVWMLGRNQWSRIAADAAGETITAQHNIDLDSISVSFFKELKFPISRLNGNFGFQYVSIFQELNANVNDAGGAIVDSIQGISDMRAFGPRAIFEYYRPIGHTPLEFITTFGGSVMFGERDQFINNTATGQLNRVAADEFISLAEYSAGVQYKKTIGENRAWFGRVAFVNQVWIGGGTAVLPQDDFGLRGFTFTIGYNR